MKWPATMSALHADENGPSGISKAISNAANNELLAAANRTLIPLLMGILLSIVGWQVARIIDKQDDQGSRLTHVEDTLRSHTSSLDDLPTIKNNLVSTTNTFKQMVEDRKEVKLALEASKTANDATNAGLQSLKFSVDTFEGNSAIRRDNRDAQVKSILTSISWLTDQISKLWDKFNDLDKRISVDEVPHGRAGH